MYFYFSILSVYHFRHAEVVRKATQKRALVCINTWQGIGRHYKKNTQALASQRFSKMAQDPTPPPPT
jgi:hypothetical protein